MKKEIKVYECLTLALLNFDLVYFLRRSTYNLSQWHDMKKVKYTCGGFLENLIKHEKATVYVRTESFHASKSFIQKKKLKITIMI